MPKKRTARRRAVRNRRVIAPVSPTSKRISLVLKNLVTFLALFVLSFIIWNVSESAFLTDITLLLAILFGFLTLSFLISWLVLLLLKAIGR